MVSCLQATPPPGSSESIQEDRHWDPARGPTRPGRARPARSTATKRVPQWKTSYGIPSLPGALPWRARTSPISRPMSGLGDAVALAEQAAASSHAHGEPRPPPRAAKRWGRSAGPPSTREATPQPWPGTPPPPGSFRPPTPTPAGPRRRPRRACARGHGARPRGGQAPARCAGARCPTTRRPCLRGNPAHIPAAPGSGHKEQLPHLDIPEGGRGASRAGTHCTGVTSRPIPRQPPHPNAFLVAARAAPGEASGESCPTFGCRAPCRASGAI